MIVSGKLLDIHTREVYPASVCLKDGHIEKIEKTKKCDDIFILPGLIDSHVHIESSMLTPAEFARIAVTHGTIGAVSDPHEIANVLGVKGIDFMIENGKATPFYFWFGAPSCVPATDLESGGAVLGVKEVKQLLERDEIRYLSEMMNYPGVIKRDAGVMNKIKEALSRGKPVDGHAPGLKGDELKKYIMAGISTDHECSSIDEAIEKIELGMKVIIREGSAARNLEALKELFNVNPGMLMLCSDDIHPEMLMDRHINKLVSLLVTQGYDLFDVFRACTINPVLHYGLDCGLLREGDPADFIIVDEISEMNVLETWIKGKRIFGNGLTGFPAPECNKINRFNSEEIGMNDIVVDPVSKKIQVIEALDGELLTRASTETISGKKPLASDTGRDRLKIIVKDRYNNSPPAIGFIRGFGLKRGAFASSVAHDSHNIIAVGANDSDIVTAVNEIVRMMGGLSFADGNFIKTMKLDIGGIMANRPCLEVAEKYQELSDLVKSAGSRLTAPYMTLSFMALLVIPELKISDRGLFDGNKFDYTGLFI